MVEKHKHMSRRESQIMDIVYKRGSATAAEVREDLPDPPSYSAVRALLRVLVDKGHLGFRKDGLRYVFFPTLRGEVASRSALRRLLDTFFGGSAEKAVAALLDLSEAKLSERELDRLASLIKKARKRGV